MSMPIERKEDEFSGPCRACDKIGELAGSDERPELVQIKPSPKLIRALDTALSASARLNDPEATGGGDSPIPVEPMHW